MTHLSEDSRRLQIRHIEVRNASELREIAQDYANVCLLLLPTKSLNRHEGAIENIGQLVGETAASLGPSATLISFGDIADLVHIQSAIATDIRYQLLVSIKTLAPRIPSDLRSLPEQHIGALVHTKYVAALRHTHTRIEYSYCPVCHRTTKDYGGKKHTYHEYGTLISDVWRDIAILPDGDPSPVIARFADLFGVKDYEELLVIVCRHLNLRRTKLVSSFEGAHDTQYPEAIIPADRLINGDCLNELKKIPASSIDFVFADPPYNLKKSYSSYSDDLAITEYFEWCDEWFDEITRILRPGSTFAILNIPLWAIRHYVHLETILVPQNWITWDALSYPVRKIMPANYSILCFSKGTPRELPGLSRGIDSTDSNSHDLFRSLEPLAENYCLRKDCIRQRKQLKIADRVMLSDLWWDIHRLKHNSRRVDHPTQLPPQLMYRLISLFTQEGEIVLDCFNGTGTTTLAAHQLGRHFIGIELDPKYHSTAIARHNEIRQGLDPFRKVERVLTSKNSPVPRMSKRKYVISKKALQLEVKRIAIQLGRLPTRDEVIAYGKHPIKYYDEYFVSWGEVCAAARTTGMTEYKNGERPESEEAIVQLEFDLDI